MTAPLLPDITATASWRRLEQHHRDIGSRHLRELFAQDQARGRDFTVTAADVHIDYSKHRIDRRTLPLLLDLAREVGLEEHRDAMLRGAHTNTTEDRAVLHTALRLPATAHLEVDGTDVVTEVQEVLGRMGEFAEQIRSGRWRGATGEPITTVVNIGIGGSDLGPEMVIRALRHYAAPGLALEFVSNVDPADLISALAGLDPAKTLFIVASKTFSTIETLTNASAARRWLTGSLGEEAVRHHFVAVSTNTERVRAFGIDTTHMFGFWDWVGGRYSVDSAVGLSVMIAIGRAAFTDFLQGFHAVDEHFAEAPLAENAPVLLGLLSFWYVNFFGAQSRAVVPYSNDLGRFPAYLQQLAMESNGKCVRRDGSPVVTDTGPVFWGESGTNGQHAFFQLLHQGTILVPCDVIGFAEPTQDLPQPDGAGSMHDIVMSNLFAQTRVLAFGRTHEEVLSEGVARESASHRVMPGNRPSTTILAPKLTPRILGELISLYEHEVFVEGLLSGINSYDQWGVELGKSEAVRLEGALTGRDRLPQSLDSSTQALVHWYRRTRSLPDDAGR